MDFGLGGGNGYGDDQEGSSSRRGNKYYHRHSAHQTQQLEAYDDYSYIRMLLCLSNMYKLFAVLKYPCHMDCFPGMIFL